MINDEIRDREIRLIDSEGEQLGIMSSKDALALAVSKNLDLVKIAPQAKPPVCKIMDYGKYKFALAKKEKEARKNQHIMVVKEVRLSLAIDDHDFNTKLNHAIKFLEAGNKVKVAVRFRGREISHSELGGVLLNKFADLTAQYGSPDKRPVLEGRNMIMMISPKA